jgi:citrate lyase subunit beta / citryl-CoA lyase
MKNIQKASAGQRGEKVRSDCYIEIELKNSGGIDLNFSSKVASMYGDSIKEQILQCAVSLK